MKDDKFYHVKYMKKGEDKFQMMSLPTLIDLYNDDSVLVEDVSETTISKPTKTKTLSKRQIERLVKQPI
jgi:hypothetical protein